jgi:hypothetical protein
MTAMNEWDDPEMQEPENQSLADDAVPLCPYCLEPCDPLDNYCPNCGSNEAINPLASYMPFVDIRFSVGMVGKLWRKTWSGETSLIERVLYIALFVLFYPFILLVGLPVLICEKIKRGQSPDSQQERS